MKAAVHGKVRSKIWANRYLQTASRPQPLVRSQAKAERAQEIIAAVERTRPYAGLFDSFQRRHDYLRISLTERCNLRCFYCMPSEGITLSPAAHLLTDDELIHLATLFVEAGVKKIRLTGGEPTVRKSVIELVGRLHRLRDRGLQSIGMTSNGIALSRKLPALVHNGLTHLNLSLDTLDPFKFEVMTRRQGHKAVMHTLKHALSIHQLESVKLNVVIVRGLNEDEIPAFVDLTRDSALSIRFIEFMPFNGNNWDKSKMIPSSVLIERIRKLHPGISPVPDFTNDTARSYTIPGHLGTVGFISSMSDHFCGTCNRLRLTADGQIKVCLFDGSEVSLRDLLRNGRSDDEILETIRSALYSKKEKHAGMEDIDVINNRPMIKIGERLPRPPTFGRAAAIARRPSLRIFGPQIIPSTKTAAFYSSLSSSHLTHVDERGKPSMVDVSEKVPSRRFATAEGRIIIPEAAYRIVCDAQGALRSDKDGDLLKKEKVVSKGNVCSVAELAGIMASKRTSDLIPLCHPLPLSHVAVDLVPEKEGSASKPERYSILCRASVRCEGKTGVEMEALTAVTVSLLTVWDMLKAVAGKEMTIEGIHVCRKEGGKSGDFVRKKGAAGDN